MMKKLLLLFGLMFSTVLLLSGCGDKSETDVSEGDPNDVAYLATKANVDSSMTEFNEDLVETVDSLMGGGMHKVAEPDSVDYDDSTGWHVRSRIYEDDYWNRSVVDSFRFADADTVYQRCRDSTTYMFERRLKRTMAFDSGYPDGPQWEKNRNRNMNWFGLTDSLVTLNGDIYRYYYGQNFRRTFEHTVEGDFEDVVFETEDLFNRLRSHPIDGQFVGSLVTDKELPYREVHFEGEFTVTFYPDHYHVYLVSGDNYWEWDVYYEE